MSPVWAAVSILAVLAAAAWREALFVALPEELLFRGVLQGEIEARSRRPFVAVFAAAAAFALAHVLLGGGASGWLTFFPGCLFGVLRWRSRSLWPAVAAHAIANVLWLGR